MKKTLGILLVGSLLGTVILAGCGQKEDVAPSKPQDAPPAQSVSGGVNVSPSTK